MIKHFFITCVLLAITFTSLAQSDEESIRDLLAQQTKEWNTGDISQFMKGYWQSDSLMFIGKSGITYGWQNTLDNYKKNYKDTVAMGKLKFNLLEFKPLSNQYYFVVGKWHLARAAGNLEGIFTLLFRKMKNTWVIVADHSS